MVYARLRARAKNATIRSILQSLNHRLTCQICYIYLIWYNGINKHILLCLNASTLHSPRLGVFVRARCPNQRFLLRRLLLIDICAWFMKAYNYIVIKQTGITCFINHNFKNLCLFCLFHYAYWDMTKLHITGMHCKL